MASDDATDDAPAVPDELSDYDMGSAKDAIADDTDTYTKWVADHERGLKWWFELRERVPVRKKGQILEKHTAVDEAGLTLSYDYYIDMLEYLIVDWSGADDDDAPGIRELLTRAYTGTEPDNPVFEELQDEVPPPFQNVPQGDLKK